MWCVCAGVFVASPGHSHRKLRPHMRTGQNVPAKDDDSNLVLFLTPVFSPRRLHGEAVCFHVLA